MTRRWVGVACALIFAGCGGGNQVGDDGGIDAAIEHDAATPVDASTQDASRGDDAGSTDAAVIDAGSSTDGGSAVDGGSESDSGASSDDAGSSSDDAGSSSDDAGSPGDDAGSASDDAGAAPSDAGSPSDDGGAVSGCTSNAECGRLQFCETRPGDCGGTGACMLRPDFCSDLFDPVCGCDGNDYSNACHANSAGTSVAHRGRCTAMCSLRPTRGCCFIDGDCGGGERCVGEMCIAGGEGTCVMNPFGREQCWEDADCRAGGTCVGARRCACGAACLVPDAPGTCVSAS